MEDGDRNEILVNTIIESSIIIVAGTCAPFVSLFNLLIEKGVITQEEFNKATSPQKVQPLYKELESKLKKSAGLK